MFAIDFVNTCDCFKIDFFPGLDSPPLLISSRWVISTGTGLIITFEPKFPFCWDDPVLISLVPLITSAGFEEFILFLKL